MVSPQEKMRTHDGSEEEGVRSSPQRRFGSDDSTQKPSQRCLGTTNVRMLGVIPSNLYDLSKALQSSLVVLLAMLAQQSLHQPGFGVPRHEVDDPVKEDLSG